ncbi:MAG: hypothetical protein ACE5GO_04710 [Anaerolineales bacterium]
MKVFRHPILLFSLPFFIALLFSAQLAQAQSEEPFTGAALCKPGAERGSADACLVAGPAAYRQRLAEQGIPLPFRPLPGASPGIELAYTSNSYARVVTDNAPVSWMPTG